MVCAGEGRGLAPQNSGFTRLPLVGACFQQAEGVYNFSPILGGSAGRSMVAGSREEVASRVMQTIDAPT
jgi:hypothetical protein